jgi:hypothetical protein
VGRKRDEKIGASVDNDPAIKPVIAGCTRCRRNDCCSRGSGIRRITVSGEDLRAESGAR